ncbi:MAG: hypothetical protein OP8BY_2013 [Candidatus Saccharicenans subterraneus]|uniref:SnoaL-like domain-containing protein n=1 Tax=Candidatus Saccharicenans subterraneus TaxID=2508984 RepID=A0A3E2BMZ9_9BACT|nr:MAG: hypothetical protein OP8BY_2013 [Candidatus Saccharicenans subterraneum]
MGSDLKTKKPEKPDAPGFFGRLFSLMIILSAAACFLTRFQACQKPDEAEEIRESLRTVAVQAEKKNLEKIKGYLADDYRDFEGRDSAWTASLLEYYFKNYQGIAIHLLDIYVDINKDPAEAEADVLLSSGPLETLRKLVGVVGVYYRFNFSLEKRSGRWQIIYAAWKEVDSNSLLPGSRAILKKIFPDQF